MGASSPVRVFKAAGVYEADHVDAGLDLWFEVHMGTASTAGIAAAFALGDEALMSKLDSLELGLVKTKSTYAPSDTFYASKQAAHYTAARIPETWAQYGGGSPLITVQMVDSGMDMDHPDLALHKWNNPGEICGNGLDDDGNGYIDDCFGYNHADGLGNAFLQGAGSHGTHTAGTVAADSDNGWGVAGVAGGANSINGKSGVKLMISTVFGNNQTFGFGDALVYGADMGAHISSNSWGYTTSGYFERSVLAAIDYAASKNVLVVFAAGNDASSEAFFPGAYETALNVAAVGNDGIAAFFTNYGTTVDIAAPGVDIYSTAINGYATLSGTSMACPHVSGAIALALSTQPNVRLDTSKVRKCFEATAKNVDSLNSAKYKGQLGAGLLDAFSAVGCVAQLGASTPETTADCNFLLLSGGTFASTMGTYEQLATECASRPYYKKSGSASFLYFDASLALWLVGPDGCGSQRVSMYNPDFSVQRPELITQSWFEFINGKWVQNPAVKADCLSPTSAPTPKPSTVPSSKPSLKPTAAPIIKPTPLPTNVPVPVPTVSALPTPVPSPAPSSAPSTAPSAQPTALPTTRPPTAVPSSEPSSPPSAFPTGVPTLPPTSMPSRDPSAMPTPTPSGTPTARPTLNPAPLPTSLPTVSEAPTFAPSSNPTALPTAVPTAPSSAPSIAPSPKPTSNPAPKPTPNPTPPPTPKPTLTAAPTTAPTRQTLRPTQKPNTPTLPSPPLAAFTGEARVTGISATDFGQTETAAFEAAVADLVGATVRVTRVSSMRRRLLMDGVEVDFDVFAGADATLVAFKLQQLQSDPTALSGQLALRLANLAVSASFFTVFQVQDPTPRPTARKTGESAGKSTLDVVTKHLAIVIAVSVVFVLCVLGMAIGVRMMQKRRWREKEVNSPHTPNRHKTARVLPNCNGESKVWSLGNDFEDQ
ncbi:peptidase S8/S53 domain-containing protein [Pelagophyceae sp. CCMP2097]|nr:peptidase S8/S53 domain-containing protein [Pelagophyceae sp. CCMP2097]